ncbi:MAG TPA: UDP-N-acetylglucosamine 2-epimerase (non-hydrolyzing), partial [Stenomitos sp.]
LRQVATEVLVHTGQHFDANMSDVFFEELAIPKPDYHLGVGGGSHGAMTGAMLAKIEEVLLSERPDWVLVYGDTNSTLAGALAATKLHIPVAHVEAGLRSFNRRMPEEINRVLTDHASQLLFAPTQTAVRHLANEGVTEGVHRVGDVMFDATLHFKVRAQEKAGLLDDLGLKPEGYYLATVHRAENTDDPERLKAIFGTFPELDRPVVLPLHPRTRKRLEEQQFEGVLNHPNLRIIPPVGYLDMLMLQANAAAVLTDSGGVQKEAYFLGVPCRTLRDETEWDETLSGGWNVLVGADPEALKQALSERPSSERRLGDFGEGQAASLIASLISAAR